MNPRIQQLAVASAALVAFTMHGMGAVFAERWDYGRSGPSPSDPVYIASIPGEPGMYIQIMELGIGGEPDAFSGPAIFSAFGSGLDFTWGAGGQIPFSATYELGPTLEVSGPSRARGFTYQDVSLYTTELGGSVDIRFNFYDDTDGLFTYASDSMGTFFDDSAFLNSSRVWLRYEYTTVPEPSSTLLALLAGLAFFTLRSLTQLRNNCPTNRRTEQPARPAADIEREI